MASAFSRLLRRLCFSYLVVPVTHQILFLLRFQQSFQSFGHFERTQFVKMKSCSASSAACRLSNGGHKQNAYSSPSGDISTIHFQAFGPKRMGSTWLARTGGEKPSDCNKPACSSL